MRVAIDVSSLAREGLTGIGVYIRHLVTGLAAHPGIDVRAVYRPRLHAKREQIARHLEIRPERYVPLLGDRGVDLFHGPDFRLPRFTRLPTVVTVHDLAVFETGLLDDDFARQGREKMVRLVEHRRPDRVIAVSHFTRAKILEHFPGLAGRVDVVHLGYDPGVLSSGDATLPGTLTRPYLLFIGTLERRKNVAAVVDAFERVRDATDVQLVIAGGDGFDARAIHERVDASRHRDAIIRLGFVDDALRAALLRSAQVFVYPSLYEGFGLPVLEAMAAGAPVVTTRYGAVAEVAGDAAMLVEPHAEAIADGILRILQSPPTRAALVESGHARARQLTWERCVEQTVEVYRREMRGRK
jgi:glycosyltransferase involved in cell wall biosynthesis